MRRIAWIGRYRGYSGFAQATRRYVASLLPLIDNLIIAPLEVLENSDPYQPLVGDIEDSDFKLVNHLPTTDPEANAYLSVYEFDRIPEEWIPILNQAQLILTQSHFCQGLFAKSINDPSKIHVISYILPDTASPEGEQLRFDSPDVCIFGSVFEWIPRKAPERMIEAFLNEFSNNDPVRLILRTDHPTIRDLPKYVSATYHDSCIQILSSPIPDITSFYRGLNCYISCTAGEGFGQTMAEAMACGVPTIASNYSGNLEFMNNDNSWLVEVEDWSPGEPDPQFNWRLPKIDSIQKAMREVYALWESGKTSEKVKKAMKITKIMNARHVGADLFNILAPFLK